MVENMAAGRPSAGTVAEGSHLKIQPQGRGREGVPRRRGRELELSFEASKPNPPLTHLLKQGHTPKSSELATFMSA